MKTNLQIPIDKALRDSSARVAKEYGYSSLQDAVRMFLTQLATKKITINITSREPDELLTAEQEKVLTKKYQVAKKEMSIGEKNTADNIDELMQKLNSK